MKKITNFNLPQALLYILQRIGIDEVLEIGENVIDKNSIFEYEIILSESKKFYLRYWLGENYTGWLYKINYEDNYKFLYTKNKRNFGEIIDYILGKKAPSPNKFQKINSKEQQSKSCICDRCGGNKIIVKYLHINGGICYKCNGTGVLYK